MCEWKVSASYTVLCTQVNIVGIRDYLNDEIIKLRYSYNNVCICLFKIPQN